MSNNAENTNTGICLGLAELPPAALMDENGLAAALAICTRTVHRMVARFELPPGIPLAGKSQWLAGRVLAWIERRAERAEKAAEAEEERIGNLS